MSSTPDLAERFERAFADQPAPRPVEVRLAAGRRALRRRRLTTGVAAGALTAAAVLGTTVLLDRTPTPVVAGDPAAPDGADREPSPTSAPTPDGSLDVPVKPWPYSDQGVDPMPLWIGDDGLLYRHSAGVSVLGKDEVAEIIDVTTGRPTGTVDRYRVRWLGETSTFVVEVVDGVAMGGGPLPDDAETIDGPWYYEKVGGAHELFTDPAGITSDGRLDPRDGAVVSRERPASVFDESRFAETPSAGVVDYLGTRYYALVGYQPDAHDVIVIEPAPPGRTIEQWLGDVRDRMRAGDLP